ARSAEAKKYVPMGVPFYQIKPVVRREKIVVCSGNLPLYTAISERIMEMLNRWTPDIEVYSIDEAFLDFTGLFIWEIRRTPGKKIVTKLEDRLQKLAGEMILAIWNEVGIPVSIGIGPNKTVAKLANRVAKDLSFHYCNLLDDEKRIDVLKNMPLEEVWGIGRRILPKLKLLGVQTAWDLSQLNPVQLGKRFSVSQERTVRELCGECCLEFNAHKKIKKNIQVSSSFGTMVSELSELETAVSSFAARAAVKLRRQKSVTTSVFTRLYTNPYRQDLPQYFPERGIRFSLPTGSTPEIIRAALANLREIYQPGFLYKRAKVMLTDLLEESSLIRQPCLFDLDPDHPEESRKTDQRVMNLMDQLNSEMKNSPLFFASEIGRRTWKPHSDFHFPVSEFPDSDDG
ncbi:MAG: Y-family DNA polymerase, partial [Thermoguttaceae bacterium]|nr:Y-family DNA polymerase [Thermoguttaceae bacterium]